MDRRGLLLLLLLGILCVVEFCCTANGNLVFPVQHKFKGRERSLSAIKAHDANRRGRFLSAVDINLGGDGRPADTGLYYTKLQLGTPPKDFYVQVDSGSDILWVNCIECTTCPKKSDLGMDLTLFNPKGSTTSNLVPCSGDFCTSTYDGPISGCKQDMACPYSITYGDGSTSTGYFVKDYLTFNKVNGNLHTSAENSTVIFGCGGQQSGALASSNEDALDGIMGFGQANNSILSQLAASGKVKKIFSHCLDNIDGHGGGIFAIGEVVEPKVKTIPLVPKMAHYNVVLKEIEVDKDVIQLPIDIFDSANGRGTIIDSGTTLVYLPGMIYDQIVPKVLARQPGLKLYLIEEQFTCFRYDENLDDGFPVIKFHFEDDLSLIVYPHDYLFPIKGGMHCIGWQKMASNKNGRDLILLGDLVLSNKLVLYNLENMTIGWTDYNCSSSIKVKDETTGSVYAVGAHDISSASTVLIGKMLTFFLFLIVMLNNLTD